MMDLVHKLKSEASGQFIDRARVVDNLLDLRLAALEPYDVKKVDDLLKNIPGATVVETSWWLATLESLDVSAYFDSLVTSPADLDMPQ